MKVCSKFERTPLRGKSTAAANIALAQLGQTVEIQRIISVHLQLTGDDNS